MINPSYCFPPLPDPLSQPIFPLNPQKLAWWTNLVHSGGGIARGVARSDHIARAPGDLMFLAGEPIVILKALTSIPSNLLPPHIYPRRPHRFLAFCEGVVGVVSIDLIKLDQPLDPIHLSQSHQAQAQPQPQHQLPGSVPPPSPSSSLNPTPPSSSSSFSSTPSPSSSFSSPIPPSTVFIPRPRLNSSSYPLPSSTASFDASSYLTHFPRPPAQHPPLLQPRAHHRPKALSLHPSLKDPSWSHFHSAGPISASFVSPPAPYHAHIKPATNDCHLTPEPTVSPRLPTLSPASVTDSSTNPFSPSTPSSFLSTPTAPRIPFCDPWFSSLKPCRSFTLDPLPRSPSPRTVILSDSNGAFHSSSQQDHGLRTPDPGSDSSGPTVLPVPARLDRTSPIHTDLLPSLGRQLTASNLLTAPVSLAPESRSSSLIVSSSPRTEVARSTSDLNWTPDSVNQAQNSQASGRLQNHSSRASGKRLLPLRVDPLAKIKSGPKTPVLPSHKLEISAPTLTLHTNAAMESTIGIPATPHTVSFRDAIQFAAPKASSPDDLQPDPLASSSSSSNSSPSPHALSQRPSFLAAPKTAPLCHSFQHSAHHHHPLPLAADLPVAELSNSDDPPHPFLFTNSSLLSATNRARRRSRLSSNGQIMASPVAISSEDFKSDLVTVKGGPAFEMVKPHVKRLQSMAAVQGIGSDTQQLGITAPLTPCVQRRSSEMSQPSFTPSLPFRLASEDGKVTDEEENGGSPGNVGATGLRPDRLRRRSSHVSQLFGLPGPWHEESDFPGMSLPTAELDEEGQDRRLKESKWLSLMSGVPSQQARRNPRVRKLVSKPGGIPPSLRGRVWSYLLNSDQYRVEGVWEKLAQKLGKEEFYEEIEIGLDSCVYLDDDEGHLGDSRKADLRNILRAFAHYGSQLAGIHQTISRFQVGMGRLVGLLLTHSPAEEVFWILVGIVRNVLSGLWADGGATWKLVTDVLDEALVDADPVVAHHLALRRVKPSECFEEPFKNLFITSMTKQSLLVVLDSVMVYGFETMVKIALSQIEVRRSRILRETDPVKLFRIISGIDEPLGSRTQADCSMPTYHYGPRDSSLVMMHFSGVKLRPNRLNRLQMLMKT